MKYSYQYTFGFFAGILSIFDIAATQKNDIAFLNEGLEYDMQQLLNDQSLLNTDYQKAVDKLREELLN